MRPISGILSLSALFLFTGIAAAQTVQITGKVLERAAMRGVPGATVTWKSANGNILTGTADTGGNYTLNGNPASLLPRQVEWNGSLMRNGMLQLRTRVPNVTITTELFDSQGRTLAKTSKRLASPGEHSVPVMNTNARNFVGFLKVKAGDETYRLKVFHTGGPVPVSQASFAQVPGALARQAAGSAAGDSLIVTMSGLITGKVGNPTNTGAQADIILEYPARTAIGVGAARPYGAIVLFDGTQGTAAARVEMAAKWEDWQRFTPSPVVRFVISPDPEFPTDTNRVTMRACCPTTGTTWGYDDIQVKPIYAHGDVQLHVEFNMMGRYLASDSLNPDTSSAYSGDGPNTAAWWVNSGVYVQGRHEIQIQSNARGANISNNHFMGSAVNEFAPTSNQLTHNGVWQSYDITFRTGRYRPGTKTGPGDTLPSMSVWWNGVKVHSNRRVIGAAAGTSNHSGENMNDTLYGVKLQFEKGDVRYRNVWMKHLKIDSTGTGFGY